MEKRPDTDQALTIIQAFRSMPIRRQVEIFRELSSEAREELLGVLPNPGDIVRRVAPEEMFFSIKSLTAEQAPHLIAYTTGRQLLYILDIEMWNKDMFDAESAARWFQLIARAGDEKIIQFLQIADPELLITALQNLVAVKMRDPDIDLLEQRDVLPPFTLDDTFFVEFLSPTYENALKNYLDVIFRTDSEFYFKLMERLVYGITLENEDVALHWRRSRLQDYGFPVFEEALEIYSYLSRVGVSDPPLPEGPPAGVNYGAEGSPLVDYPLKVLQGDSLFRRSIASLDDALLRDRLCSELAHLANKVVMADGRNAGSLDDIHTSLRKVGGYINLALEDLCGDDMAQAEGFLKANHMEILFRRGFSLILDLRKETHNLLRNYDGGSENLGYPLAGLIEGLTRNRPVYAGNYVGEKQPREFESLQDIRSIRELLNAASIEERWEPI